MFKAINHHTKEIAEGDNFKAIYNIALYMAMDNLASGEASDVSIFVDDTPKYVVQVWLWHYGDVTWGSIVLVKPSIGKALTLRQIYLEKGAKA